MPHRSSPVNRCAVLRLASAHEGARPHGVTGAERRGILPPLPLVKFTRASGADFINGTRIADSRFPILAANTQDFRAIASLEAPNCVRIKPAGRQRPFRAERTERDARPSRLRPDFA